ncbi:ribose ABC transporter ATP binding subunit [Paraburkholderia sacchari]|uniref:sugar ABC transporter ATP-binding protein n=1 Tax=Paraburkholderia sacchari TaxID=159450 RepID=UPI0039A4B582
MASVNDQATPLLKMRNISKSWGSVKALDNVEFVAHGGEVHALMGENGAGKSTLMNILSGMFLPDAGGTISLGGDVVSLVDPRSARRSGIATIHQELALAENLTVAENLFLGTEMSSKGLLNRARMRVRADEILAQLAAPFTSDVIVGTLSLAHRQIVEIAKALLLQSRILVMDEPTTSLSERETQGLFKLVSQLRANGMSIIYISHRMEEIYALSDRVTVLRDGKNAGTLVRDELSPDRLVHMMVGRDLGAYYQKSHCADLATAPAVLEVRDIGDGKTVSGCSFHVRAGEVLGIAGLVGSGRTELARLVASIDPRTSGTVHIEQSEVTATSAVAAMNAGIVYLTEDRKGLGLFLDMSIRDNININISSRDAGASGVINRSLAKNRSQDAVRHLRIKAAHDQLPVGKLSGGNQQKVLLARLLALDPKVLLLDEPTRGVDIGAKIEIYQLIDALAKSGVAVVVISSEMPELIGTCDRLIVMREGEIVGEIERRADRSITQEEIMHIISAVPKESIQ